jgi:CO/xanthine dehydrogenase Mo-binding subunit
VSDLTIVDGEVRPTAGGSGVGIGVLVGGRSISRKVDPNAPLVAANNYRVIGRALPRPDVQAKVTGAHEYVQNVSLPGMLHARVIRPPSAGATLTSVDEASVSQSPGVRVVRIKNFLAVVATDEWAAVRAATALKTNWSEGRPLPSHAELENYVRKGVVDRDQSVTNRGDVAAGLASATKKQSATYYWPNQSHASLGPSCSVADVKADGSATIWSASQGTHGLRTTLARVFGLQADKTRVVFLEGSGSYGTNGSDYVAADAVLLSKTLGAPVRVQWTRQDEHRWDPKGPQQLIDIQGGLDDSGKIVAWDVQMWVPTNRMGARALLAADAAGLTQEDGQNSGALTQNGEPPYEAPNVRVVAHLMRDTPVAISNLRAPGKIANVFAVESFVDELAVLAGADPIEFRLRRLSDPRAVEALTRTAQSFNWQTRPSPNPQAKQGNLLVGRGIAYMRYKQAENYVAMAMEVSVDPASGKITVTRITCAHDCGLIVNPDALRNQVEGCIVQTLSRALHEEVTFERGRVSSADWSTYPVLTFNEVPTIDVILLNRTDQPIIGAGEAATAPVAGALANAVFDATGVRLRTAPFTAERVKAALSTKR